MKNDFLPNNKRRFGKVSKTQLLIYLSNNLNSKAKRVNQSTVIKL